MDATPQNVGWRYCAGCVVASWPNDAATSGATGVGDGGAVFAQNADVLVSGGAVSFTDNDADRHGGAMYVDGLLGDD